MVPSPRIRFTSKVPFAILLAVALAVGVTVFALRSERTAAPPVTFVSLTGERIAMSGLSGKVVLVEFWATDCATCVKEMPQLVQTYEKSMSKYYKRWQAVYEKKDASQDPLVNAITEEQLGEQVVKMRGELLGILNFLDRIGVQLDDHYMHIRHLVENAN